jgi:hypothetical protein
MERQAGLGRSLEDVLDSLAPIESADSPPAHALFGLAPDDAASTNGPTKAKNKKTKSKGGKKKKKKKKKLADVKSTDSKKKKKKSKGGKKQQ